MAATVVVTRTAVPGDLKAMEATIAGDSSYATNGYAVTPANFNLTSITGIISVGNSTGRHLVYDTAAAKVLFIVTATGAEVVNTTNVTASVIPVIVYGK
jgi:hypothetical protein